MRKFGIMLALAAAFGVAATLTPAAVASPYHRDCGRAGEGGVLGNSHDVQSSPYGIRMSASNAARIASRLPPGEFGTREKASDIPCWIAGTVAQSAGTAWLQWSGNTGTVHAVGGAEFGTVEFGWFHCTGRSIDQTVHLPPMTYRYSVAEMCTRGRGAQRIISTFRIGTYSQS
jgi:hypothetical protein